MSPTGRFFLVLGIAASASAVASAPVVAQECVEGCDPCAGWNSWEPYEIDGGYEWYYGGCAEGEGCEWCLRFGSVDEAPEDAATLGKLVVNAPIAQLPELITAHGARLELHPTRALLIVRGSACNPDADLVSAVLVLTPGKAREIRAAGIHLLGETSLTVTQADQ